MEKFELSLEELEAQHVELVPERVEMRRFFRRRRPNLRSGNSFCVGGVVQNCDSVVVNTGSNTGFGHHHGFWVRHGIIFVPTHGGGDAIRISQ